MLHIYSSTLFLSLLLVTYNDSKGKFHRTAYHKGIEREERCNSTLALALAVVGVRWSMPRPGYFILGKYPVPVV